MRLKDVGHAEDGLEEFRSYSQRDDKPGIALQIRRQCGTNTVQVAQRREGRDREARDSELAAQGVDARHRHRHVHLHRASRSTRCSIT